MNTEKSSWFGRFRHWSAVALLGLVVMLVVIGVWWLQSGNRLLDYSSTRNNRELEILTQNIESWPVVIDSMAKSYLLPSNLTFEAEADHRGPDNFPIKAHSSVLHPTLGSIKFYYYSADGDSRRLSDAVNCKSIEIVSSGNSYFLRRRGIIDRSIIKNDVSQEKDELEEVMKIFSASRRAAGNSITDQNEIQKRKDRERFYHHLFEVRGNKSHRDVCYEVSVPLASLANVESDDNMDVLLIADAKGKIVAQLGDETVPVADVGEITTDAPLTRTLLVGAAGKDATQDVVPPLVPLMKATDPIPVRIGGVDYIAYVRTFHFDVDNAPPTAGANAKAKDKPDEGLSIQANGVTAIEAHRDTAKAAPAATEFRAISLVREAKQRGELLRRPPSMIVLFGIPLLLLVALVPVIKLRLIGPGEAMTKIEQVAIGVGLTASVALVTGGLLFLFDINGLQNEQDRTARHSAMLLAGQFDKEMETFLLRSIDQTKQGLSGHERKDIDPPCLSEPLPPSAVLENFMDEEANQTFLREHPEYTPRSLHVEPVELNPEWASNPEMLLPVRDSINLFDARTGEPVDGSWSVGCRGNSGGRFNAAFRNYFRDVVHGNYVAAGITKYETLPVNDKPFPDAKLFYWPAYALEVVRSRTDGTYQLIAASPALDLRESPKPLEGSPETLRVRSILDAQCWKASQVSIADCFDTVLIYSRIIETFLSPVLPDRMKYAVIDLRSPALQVQFHSDAHRGKFENFSDVVESSQFPTVLQRLRQISATDEGPHVPELFDARYDGEDQRFAAVHLAHTNWALLVFYPKALPDARAAQTLLKAMISWSLWIVLLALVVPVMSGVVRFIRFVLRAIIRWIWPTGQHPDLLVVRWIMSTGQTQDRDVGFSDRLRGLVWPNPDRADDYKAIGGPVILGVVVVVPLSLLLLDSGPWRDALLLIGTFFGVIWVWWKARRNRRAAGGVFDARTLHLYWLAIVAAMVGLAVVPVTVFYLDAAHYLDHIADSDSFAAQRKAEQDRYDAKLALVRINRPYEAGKYIAPSLANWMNSPDRLGYAPRQWLPAHGHEISSVLYGILEVGENWTTNLFVMAGAGPKANHFVKLTAAQTAEPMMPQVFIGEPDPSNNKKVKNGANAPVISVEKNEQFTLSAQSANGVCIVIEKGFTFKCSEWTKNNRLVLPQSPYEWSMVLISLLISVSILCFAFRTVARHLFGAGIPIESVNYQMGREDDSKASNALLYPPSEQFSTIIGLAGEKREKYLREFEHFDLFDWRKSSWVPFQASAPSAPVSGHSAKATGSASPSQRWRNCQVFFNLELTLRDGEHRRAALKFLEDKFAEARRGGNKLQLVFLADLTPLERLLQASEDEMRTLKLAGGEDTRKELASIRRYREDVRWSRLFEEFRTYIYQPGNVFLRKFDPDKEEKVIKKLKPEVWETVARELAPLPEHVIRSLLPNEGSGSPNDTESQDQTKTSEEKLREAVVSWASNIKSKGGAEDSPPEPAAIINFLALMLIEHYQLCWAISSHAERLILLNLAHGRAINIVAAATPLRSLVRRGLVVLDPVPRLMNESFREFELQSENLWTFAEYQKQAPQGSWGLAQIPLLLFVPIGLVALGYAILDSGLGVQSLIPLAVAAAPSLLQSVGGIRRAVGA